VQLLGICEGWRDPVVDVSKETQIVLAGQRPNFFDISCSYQAIPIMHQIFCIGYSYKSIPKMDIRCYDKLFY
jgi:hypothetical protein